MFTSTLTYNVSFVPYRRKYPTTVKIWFNRFFSFDNRFNCLSGFVLAAMRRVFCLVRRSTGAPGLMKCNNGCVFHYGPLLGNAFVWRNGPQSGSFIPNHQPFLLLQETNEIVAIKKFKDSEGKTLIK